MFEVLVYTYIHLSAAAFAYLLVRWVFRLEGPWTVGHRYATLVLCTIGGPLALVVAGAAGTIAVCQNLPTDESNW